MGRPKKHPKFADLAADFFEGLSRKRSDSEHIYRSRLKHILRIRDDKGKKYGFGRKRIDKITTSDIAAWQDVVIANFRGQTPTALRQLLGRILKHGRRQGYWVPELPDERPPRAEAVPGSQARKAMKEADVARFLRGAQILGPVRQLWWLLFFFTGMRLNEGRALQWEDIDFEMGPLPRVLVAYGLDARTGRRKATKTKETRQVPVHPQLDPFLRAWKAATPKGGPRDRVLVDGKGKAPSADTLRRSFAEDLLALGIEEVHTPHHIRHTFVTLVSATDGIQTEWSDRLTHAPNARNVANTYRQTNYKALCREFSKWKIEV